MGANPSGATMRQNVHRRLIRMLVLFSILIGLIGLFATFPILTRFSLVLAAGGAQINAGGPAALPFIADTDFSGGSTASVSNPIDTICTLIPAGTTMSSSPPFKRAPLARPGRMAQLLARLFRSASFSLPSRAIPRRPSIVRSRVART